MEVTGRIVAIMDKQSGDSERGHWERQNFVVEYFADPRDRYSKRMVFSVFGADRLQKFNIQMGVEYVINFDIDANESRKAPGQWFNDIQAWKVEPTQAQQPTDNPSELI